MTTDTSARAEDPGQAAREERFGVLPDRVPFAELVEEKRPLPANQAVDSYDPNGLGVRFSCLAADLGL